jgi:putative sigma-54 modulation protein
MKTNFTFRHAETQEPARRYLQERLDKLEKYFHRPLEANVVITLDKHRYEVEINILADGTTMTGKDTAADLMAVLDLVADKLEVQAQRHRDRYKRRKGKEVEAPFPVEPPTVASTEPQIIRSDRFQPKPLSVEEALLLLRENGDDFIVFRNAATELVNVLYCRKDGQYGLIEPNNPA